MKAIQVFKNRKITVLADQAVFSGASFATTLLLARILSPDDFGVFTSIVLLIYLMVSISNALIIQPLQVILARIKNRASYLSFTLFAQAATIFILSISTYALLWLQVDFIRALNNYAPGIILFISGFLFHDFHRKLFLARGTLTKALIIDTITGFLQVGTFAVVFLWADLGLYVVITLMGISYIPSLLISLVFSRPSFKGIKSWKGFLYMHLAQGKWLLMTSVLQWWANNLFMVASGIFLGARALGALRLVQSFFGALNVLLQTFENYALPQAAFLFQSSIEESKLYLRQISLKGSLIFGGVLLIAFLFSNQIITLAGGPEYAEYAFLVKGMALLYFVIFAGYPIRMAIRMMVLNRLFFIGYVISFLFSLISFNYLLKEWNLWGAIIGLIINQLILLTYWQYALVKKEFVLWK
jgi:O-antigen/teichoic acid export membrane protein